MSQLRDFFPLSLSQLFNNIKNLSKSYPVVNLFLLSDAVRRGDDAGRARSAGIRSGNVVGRGATVLATREKKVLRLLQLRERINIFQAFTDASDWSYDSYDIHFPLLFLYFH